MKILLVMDTIDGKQIRLYTNTVLSSVNEFINQLIMEANWKRFVKHENRCINLDNVIQFMVFDINELED